MIDIEKLTNLALLFPGQGAQSLNMMQNFTSNKVVREIFELASDSLGQNLWDIQCTDENLIHATTITQPLMLTASFAIYAAFKQHVADQYGIQKIGKVAAGHSLGEYTALVATEAISLDSAIQLVKTRSELMAEVSGGAMAVILGLDSDSIKNICQNISAKDFIVEAVNFNTPTQTVISGYKPAVMQAQEICKLQGAKRCITLNVSVPAHSSLMQNAASQFIDSLLLAEIKKPQLPVIHNADVCSYNTEVEIRTSLQKQLSNPVLWYNSLKYIQNEFSPSMWLEFSPNPVLTSMVPKQDGYNKATCIRNTDFSLINI
jgi:[acyl-carrier-protein] S-malonyltransferase